MSITYFEFFAGGGMVRAGLGERWTPVFANDFDENKAIAYRNNWGDEELHVGDVAEVTPEMLPGHADMAWASFPCQDLSLAGSGRGLNGERSAAFWPFWNLMKALDMEGRAPHVIALENVYGTVRSRKGQDFKAITTALTELGYKFGAMLMDAKHFLPQSRLRLFIVGVKDTGMIPTGLTSAEPHPVWHPNTLREAVDALPMKSRKNWIWWNLPTPPFESGHLRDLIEEAPESVEWDTPDKTEYLLSLMSDAHLARVEQMKTLNERVVGTVYRRTRRTPEGKRVQRAEVRFDGIAGCLRTPTGGSSRQTILVIDGDTVRSRLLSTREAARLMGLPDSYWLPKNYNAAYHVAGDGVAVPVVRFLAEHLMEPLVRTRSENGEEPLLVG